MDKKRHLKVDISFIDPGDISSEIKEKVKPFFPFYFSEDEEEYMEEVEYCIENLKSFIQEHPDDEKILNFIALKACIVSTQCPITKIANLYGKFLKELQEKHPDLQNITEGRKTLYFLETDLPHLDKIIDALDKGSETIPDITIMKNMNNSDLQSLLKDLYKFYNGRIPKLEQCILNYPEFLDKSFKVQKGIMVDEGLLPLDFRYFIALTAACSYSCEYLYYLLMDSFLEAGGDIEWLSGDTSKLPLKLLPMIEMCYNFAYSPWAYWKESEKTALLTAMLKGKGDENWSWKELVQAILIISYYHSLCSFVYSVGILPELDFPRDVQKDNYMRATDEGMKGMLKNSPLARKSNGEVIKQLNELSQKSENEEKKNEEKPNEKELNFNKDEPDNGYLATTMSNQMFNKFYSNKLIAFETSKNHLLTADDYNWKINGFSKLSDYSPALADSINEKFEYIMKMTQNSFGETVEVKTGPFRNGIVYYIENIYGYVHRDYDYKEMNNLLQKEFKSVIKCSASTPNCFHFGISSKNPFDFKPNELLHVYLLVMETKFHIELMYGLLALEKV